MARKKEAKRKAEKDEQKEKEEKEENWPVANMMAKLWVRSQRPAEAAQKSAKRRSNGVVSI